MCKDDEWKIRCEKKYSRLTKMLLSSTSTYGGIMDGTAKFPFGFIEEVKKLEKKKKNKVSCVTYYGVNNQGYRLIVFSNADLSTTTNGKKQRESF